MTEAGPESQLDSVAILMRRWHRGDEQAFEALIARVMPRLHDYVSRNLGERLRGKLDSQDVVQEAVTHFFRDAPRFVVERDDQLLALVRQIALNVIRGHHRYFQRKRRQLSIERPLTGMSTALFDPGTPSQVVQNDQRDARVRLALELVEPIEQRIVCMRIYDECSWREIAQQVGMTEDAARKRFGRALRKLETKVRCLEKDDIWSFLAS